MLEKYREKDRRRGETLMDSGKSTYDRTAVLYELHEPTSIAVSCTDRGDLPV